MKILLFGHVRTRSSYLLDIACNAHNSVNLFEDYLEIDQRKIHQTYLKKDPDKLWLDYQSKFNDLTSKYFNTYKSFGIKIFPLSYYNLFKSLPVITKEPNFIITSKDFLNLDSLRLKEYDKIFVTYRKNKVDLLCSYLFAQQNNESFLFTEHNKHFLNFYKSRKHTVNPLNMPSYWWIKTLFINTYINENIHKYLEKQNIPYTRLEYNEVPSYIENTYPNIKTKYIESQIDYKTMVKNYSFYEDMAESYKEFAQTHVQCDDLFSE